MSVPRPSTFAGLPISGDYDRLTLDLRPVQFPVSALEPIILAALEHADHLIIQGYVPRFNDGSCKGQFIGLLAIALENTQLKL